MDNANQDIRARGAYALARLRHYMVLGARTGWYGAHYLAINRMRGPLTPPGETPIRLRHKMPGWRGVLGVLRSLIEQDFRHVEAGLYKVPSGGMPVPGREWGRLLRRSYKFLRDVPAVDARRLARYSREVSTRERRGQYPDYYLQNFHYQSDGWLSKDSAEIYDTQVEVLFGGTASVMRRQALVPISRWLRGKDQRKVCYLDVATGTGAFLEDICRNWPRVRAHAFDLSPPYVAYARRRLHRWSRLRLFEANAEQIPLADASQDIITCIYLFHELPPKIRKTVAAEIARVLRPGGLFVLVDALQTGDQPLMDGLLEFFPQGFYEPWFASYLKEDLGALFAPYGLVRQEETPAYLSRVMTFCKRDRAGGT